MCCELHYNPQSKICPYLAYLSVRVKMTPVTRGEKFEPGWKQQRVMLWALTIPAWLQIFPLDFLSGGPAGSCAWTWRAFLCKHFENLELVLQAVMLFGWYDYLSVLQLAARLYPMVLFGSTLICKDRMWQLLINFTLAPKFSFWLPQKPSNATSSYLLLLQIALLSDTWSWGRCSHEYLRQWEKSQYNIFMFVFFCLLLVFSSLPPSSTVRGVCIS